VVAIGWLHVVAAAAAAQSDPGQAVFQAACSGCHTIGGGRLVGPDLLGVGERRSEDWIIRFVQHPQAVILAGDPTAVSLFAEYQQMAMPDQPLSANEIRSILAYIRSAGGGLAASTAPAPAVTATEDQIQLGQALFDGKARFTNGGPTCISCHDVNYRAVTAGGALARELTTAFSRLSGAGIQAILTAPPFPVMQRAYRDHPLTDAEVVALVGFLGRVSEQPPAQPRNTGPRLAAAGTVGALLLLAIYSVVWSKRLKRSVNQDIYDRQITST
jgi:mono/diheme cytochrome c family protein